MFEKASGYFYKQVLKMRHPADVAWVMLYPAVGILSIGIFAIFLFAKGETSLNPLFFVAAGAIVWDFYGLVQKSITYSLMHDVWDGCLRHEFARIFSFGSFLVGNVSFGALTGAVAVLMVSGVAYMAFNFNILAAGATLVISLAAVTVFGAACGLMITSMMLRKTFVYMQLTWMVTGVIMVFSGVYYPVDILPEPFKSFGELLPATHAISAIRGALGLQGVDVTVELLYSFLGSFILLGLAVWFFKDSIRVARIKGTLLHEM